MNHNYEYVISIVFKSKQIYGSKAKKWQNLSQPFAARTP